MALITRLAKKGFSLKVIDSISKQIHSNLSASRALDSLRMQKVQFIKGSVAHRAALEKAIEGAEVLIHLAAETGTGQSMYEPALYTATNVYGTALVYDILIKSKPRDLKKIILTSSRAVYGEGAYQCKQHGRVYPGSRTAERLAKGLFDLTCPFCGGELTLEQTAENAETKPVSVYGLTKLMQEQFAIMMGNILKIQTTVLRLQNVYGPGQALQNPYTGILSVFTTLLRNNLPIEVYEDGNETRDFVYIDDVLKSIELALLRTDLTQEVVNIGSGNSTAIIDVAYLLRELNQSSVPIVITRQYRQGDIRHNVADISKAKSLLRYEPEIPLELGLERYVQWTKNQTTVRSLYQVSKNRLKEKGLLK